MGDIDDPGTRELASIAWRSTSPGAVVAVGRDSDVPLLRDRPLREGAATAYVCRNFTCDEPTTQGSVLAARVGSVAE